MHVRCSPKMTFLTRGAERTLAVHRFHLSARVLFRKMSAQAALAKLPSPLRDLVTSAAQDGSEDFGRSEKDKAEVSQWLEKVVQGDVAKPENFKVRTSSKHGMPGA